MSYSLPVITAYPCRIAVVCFRPAPLTILIFWPCLNGLCTAVNRIRDYAEKAAGL